MAKKKPSKSSEKSFLSQILVVSFFAVLGFLAVQYFPGDTNDLEPEAEKLNSAPNDTKIIYTPEPRPKYWFYMARGYMWIFFSVDNVLKKLGLEKIEVKIDKISTVHNNWDLLWSYGMTTSRQFLSQFQLLFQITTMKSRSTSRI